ncbi:LysR family transcriptional regulator [Amycolatopsis sp. NPDC098790]|uniref:LysR family transcriptional regulator n=1 Tax=Amycolatopsis sp. NPDC098790 TaxID=3363939 RepID=UPI0038073535
MSDLDLRLVRSFAVVAEHRHFGRAAAELHLTQSSLSRQIVRLERQVGVRLLDRTPQGTRLTEAGEAFLPLAADVLRAAADAVARARATAHPSRITVGFTGNLIVTPAVRELRRHHPGAEVRTQHLPWDGARAALLEHRVDVAVVRLPLQAAQLHVTVLYDEPRVLLVPCEHRLAGKESVTLADIADEPLPRALDAEWDAFWRVDPRPDGRAAPGGPLVEAVEDKIELVASGQAVAIIPALPAAVTGYRADLTTVPLEGVEPSRVAVVTRASERNRLVAAFREYARALLTPPE